MNTLRIPDTRSRLDIPTGECKACGKPFVKFNSLQPICLKCAKQVGPLKRKAERAELKRRKEAAKTRSQWMAEAQQAFNAWVRKRDHDKPCISCGRHHEGQWHAGHFYSTGARPELRFNEDNCHKQCQPCNTHLHGNLLRYRDELPRRIGSARFETLGEPHPAAKFTIPDLMAIKATYRSKSKALEQASEAVNGYSA